MVFGAFVIFFTGYPHVWSIYQPYVMEQAGWTQGQSSMCFYLVLSTFVFGNIFGGRMRERFQPRQILLTGGALFTAGVIGAAFSVVSNPVWMYLTYGILQGIGQGMVYTTVVPLAQSWFPGRTGFASGVVVTANGLCGLVLAPFSRILLEKGGPMTAFLVIGGLIGLAWLFSVLFVFVPEETGTAAMDVEEPTGHQYTSAEMMRTSQFYFLFATMLFALMSYFLLSPVSQTLQMEQGVAAATAVGAVMAGSVINALARLVLPTLADKIGRMNCIIGVILTIILSMAILTVSRSYATTAGVILTYGCYGGIMGSFPSLTSSLFGMKHSGENYGYVMIGIVAANLGAPLITKLVTKTGYGMRQVFLIGMLFAVIALICMVWLKKGLNKKRAEKGKIESCA